MAKDKEPTIEEAMALVYEYRDKDPRVVALARTYVGMMTKFDTLGQQWEKLDSALDVLKRAFKR